MEPTLSGKVQLKGRFTFRAFAPGTVRFLLRKRGIGHVTAIVRPEEAVNFPPDRWERVDIFGQRTRPDEVFDNLVTDAGLAFLANMLVDTSSEYDTGLAYVAMGTGTTAPANADTALGTEYSRKSITSKSAAGGTISFDAFFPAADCTVAIKEVGVFMGASASAVADSGTLLDHSAMVYDNTGGDDLTITASFAVERA